MSMGCALRPVEIGFTLMELLVSMSLMGLLAVAIHVGFRIGTNAWAKGDSRLETIRARQFSVDLLNRQIAAMVPYYSKQKIEEAPVDVLLFQGLERGLRFVSSFSALSRSAGGLRLVEYFAAISKDKSGYALLVNERLLPDDRALSQLVFRDISRGDGNTVVVNFFEFRRTANSLCLFDGLDQVKFHYFRPESVSRESSGDKKEHLPLGVAIRLRSKAAQALSAEDFSIVVPTHASS